MLVADVFVEDDDGSGNDLRSQGVENGLGGAVKITIDIQLPPDFPEKYRESVVNVAELCKVKKSIANPPVFEIKATTV